MRAFKSILKIPMYQSLFVLSVGSTPEDGLARLKPYFTSEAENFRGLTLKKGRTVAVVMGADSLTYDTISHELFHATHMLMEMLNEDFSEDCHEPYAYLCGWLTDWTMQEIKKRKGRIS